MLSSSPLPQPHGFKTESSTQPGTIPITGRRRQWRPTSPSHATASPPTPAPSTYSLLYGTPSTQVCNAPRNLESSLRSLDRHCLVPPLFFLLPRSLWGAVDAAKAADIEAFHSDPHGWWERERTLLTAFDRIGPNSAHTALAALQQVGLLMGVVTQNIDGLHQAGGVENVIELHGTVHRLECAGVPKSIYGGFGSKGGASADGSTPADGRLSDADREAFRAALSGAPMDDRCGYRCVFDLPRDLHAISRAVTPTRIGVSRPRPPPMH